MLSDTTLSPQLIALLAQAGIMPNSPDIEPEECEPNLIMVIRNAEAARRLAAQGVDRPRNVQRTHYKPTIPDYADDDGFVTTYVIFGFDQLRIKKTVAEKMIRSGELVMVQPGETYQQDLYWRDDPWFRQNRAAVLQNCEPYMP